MLFWLSKGNFFIPPTNICYILIGLHHPLTVWSIRCGLFVLCFAFPALKFFLSFLRASLVHAVFSFSIESFCLSTLHFSLFHLLFVFFADLLMARTGITPNPPASSRNPPLKPHRNPSSRNHSSSRNPPRDPSVPSSRAQRPATSQANHPWQTPPQTSTICTVPYPGVDRVKVKVNIWTQSQHLDSKST